MRETHLSLPQLAMIAGTRAMAGVGLGLLVADRFPDRPRKAVGWTLLAVGALSTIPLAIEVQKAISVASLPGAAGAGGCAGGTSATSAPARQLPERQVSPSISSV